MSDDSFEILYRELVIYESPDGGQTVYEKHPGKLGRKLIKYKELPEWHIDTHEFTQILYRAGDCEALQDELRKLKTLWELTKKSD